MKKYFHKKLRMIKLIFIASGVALAIIGGWLGTKMMKHTRTSDSEQDINQGT